jgi:TolA-binding protein
VSKWYANDAAQLFMILQNSFNTDSSEVVLKLYVKADILKMQGKTDSAYTYYNQLTTSFPQHYLVPNAMFAQSEILVQTMSYNTAVEILKNLYKNYPYNNIGPLVLLRLSEVYLQKIKNQEEAKIWLKELMVKFPDSPQAQQAREMYRDNF